MTTVIARIQSRRDTAANWVSANTILATGEIGVETDTLRFKIGDGSSTWNTLVYEVAYAPQGTRTSPQLITALGGISILDVLREFQFVKGSGGPITVTANPQIEAGTIVGQELLLQGTDNTNTLTISNGTGLVLNGACVLASGSRIWLVWDGAFWVESSRNDI